jgi:hypothetical protein
MMKRARPTAPSEISVIVDWTAELTRAVPVNK